MRYPPAQLVTIIPMAIETRADPKTLPTTVGIVEKKPPFDMPFMMTKTTIGASVVEIGHRASMLNAVRESDMKSTFSAPNLSQRIPQQMRPTAEAKLNPATRPAPVLDERPMDLQ
jgi:hypothetical protein